MGLKNDRTFITVEDVKATFLQLLRCYKTDFYRSWFYGMNMDQLNPHNLASELG